MAAFPAIAALLKQGDVASELLASGVAGLVAQTMDTHPRDAKVWGGCQMKSVEFVCDCFIMEYPVHVGVVVAN